MSKYILPTFTGIAFDLVEPTKGMIVVEDIAHHLSMENRFNGAIKFPYPVSYHSVLCAQVAPSYLKLEMLFHDSHEAYYKDWTSPFKNMMRYEYNVEYNDIIDLYELAIQEKFDLHFDKYKDEIKEIDRRICATEIRQLLPEFKEELWYSCGGYESFKNVNILNLSFDNVETLFLQAYEKYKRI